MRATEQHDAERIRTAAQPRGDLEPEGVAPRTPASDAALVREVQQIRVAELLHGGVGVRGRERAALP